MNATVFSRTYHYHARLMLRSHMFPSVPRDDFLHRAPTNSVLASQHFIGKTSGTVVTTHPFHFIVCKPRRSVAFSDLYAAPLQDAVANIVCRSTQEEVVRSNAWRIVAPMTDVFPRRYVSVGKKVGNAAGASLTAALPRESDRPVSFAKRPGPNPTPITFCLSHLHPKAGSNRNAWSSCSHGESP